MWRVLLCEEFVVSLPLLSLPLKKIKKDRVDETETLLAAVFSCDVKPLLCRNVARDFVDVVKYPPRLSKRRLKLIELALRKSVSPNPATAGPVATLDACDGTAAMSAA